MMLKQLLNFNDDTIYIADDFVNGCLINPVLPDGFDTIPIAERDQDHMKHWYGLPFIVHDETGYSVHCLDGGAWNRSVCWGCFDALEDALKCAKIGPVWRSWFEV